MRKGRRFLAGICALALAFSFTPVGGYLPGDAGVEEAKAAESGDWEYKELENGTVEITRYTGTLKELTIPQTIAGKKVTRIGDNAFQYNTGLISIVIPGSITRIGSYAFRDCDNLTSIIIPEGVESIGYGTFMYCDSLTSVTIPGSVTRIGEQVFWDCSKLSEITVNEKNKNYSSKDGNLYDKAQTTLLQYAIGKENTSFVVPGSVTSIGREAFQFCDNLVSITIPEGVTSIGDYAFEDCDNLISIIIPEGVESIEYGTFQSCDNLKSVTIPGSVKTIRESAFSDSNKLSEIIINEKNKVYSSKDGNLYDKAQTKLIRYAIGKMDTSFVIPGSVTSIGDNAFEACVSLSSVTIPGSARNIGDYAFRDCINLASITIPGSVTSIGNYAFRNCVRLTSITIPGSVTSIGDGAFSGCTSLSSVIIPKGVTSIEGGVFSGCVSLTNVTIPEGVTEIGGAAFENCVRLNSVTIPKGVTSIEGGVFSGCASLTNVTIPEGVTEIGGAAFEGCVSLTSVNIPGNVTSIGRDAFSGCASLTSITIPENVTSIGDNAFANCSKLREITVNEKNKVYSSKDGNLYDKAQTRLIRYAIGKQDSSFSIPGSVTTIENWAFCNSAGLTSVIIPKSVTNIGEYAFQNCISLISVVIPESVTKIGFSAFSGCTDLTSVTIPQSMTEIGSYAFSGCTDLTSVTIPKSITNIGSYAFSDCVSLTSVIIPESVTSIGSSAFSNCISLSSVTIPKSITNMGSYAFSGCTGLTSVTIPEGITSIENSTFWNCINLTSIMIPGSVTTIGDRVFSGCSKLKEIRVNEKNKVYSSKDGNLYDKAQMRLIQYAVGKTDASFVIPGSVKEIGSKAFADCISLTSVTIPEGVMKIESDAFSDCTGLTSVNIPESVVSIEGTPFANCSKLKEITVNEKNKVYSSKGGNLYDKAQSRLIRYASGKSDTSFIIPRSVTIIGNSAFAGCAVLTSVTIPENVINIEYGAFADCSKLKEISVDEKNKVYSSKDGNLYNKAQSSLIQYAIGKPNSSFIIPEGVISFSYCTFSGCDSLASLTIPESFLGYGDSVEPQSPLYRCSNLREIILDENNTLYSSKDGNLYDKTQRVLLQYAVGKLDPTFTVPDGVSVLGYHAFEDCTHLTSVTIPEGMTYIMGDVFKDCVNLASVTIPRSVTEILGDIFAGCKKVMIKGYKNSYAQIYAKQHNIKFIALDDRESYKVTFNSDGGSAVATQTVAEGETAAKPADPTKKGYTFAGWYNGSTRYDFNSLIMGNLTLTAKWTYQCSTPSISKAENANGGVKLTWNKVTGAAKYRVFYKKNGKWTKIADTTGTSYTWTGAASGTSYTFTVRCVSSDGSYYTSNYNTAGKSIRYIAAPSISKAENANGGVKLTWGKVTGAAKYRVFYKKNGKWTKIADTTGTSYTWKGAKSGTKYTFTVRCVSSDGKTYTSGYNAAGKSIRYLAQPEISKFEANNSGLKITWGKVTGAAKYRVYYKTEKGWKQLRETSGTSCTINATLGKSYTYTVRAFNGSDSSTYNKSGKAFKRVATPKLSSAANVKGGVKISWGKVSGAQKYRVFYKKNGKWTKLADTTSTSYTWKKAKKGTTYTFTVRCINSNASAYTSGYNTAGKKVKYNGK